MTKNLKKFKLHYVFISLALLGYVFFLFSQGNKFTSSYSHKKMGEIYTNSQYIMGPKATTSIGDDGLFAFAGYYLFFQGGDPTKINFESPPLGEYLMGLSVFVTKNERMINIFYGLFFLLLMYKLAIKMFNNHLIASIVIFTTVFDPLFQQHLIASLLDLPQALFVLSGLLAFMMGVEKSNRWFFVSSLFMGAALSTKFFPGIIFFVALFTVWIIRSKPQKLPVYLISLCIIPIVYIASYTMFFLNGHTFIDFIQFHKFLISWRLGNPRVFGNIFYALLVGKYHNWWMPPQWLTNNEWTVIAPYLLVGSSISIIFFRKKKMSEWLFILYSVMIVFILYVAVGTTGVAKYIYPVYPLMSIFAAFSLMQIINRIKITVGKKLK